MPLPVLQRATLLSLMLVALATPVRAQDIFAVPFAGVKFGGSTSIFDLEFAADKKTFTMGASVVVLGNGVFGYEVDFGYMPNFFKNEESPPVYKPGSYVIDLSGGVLLALPEAVTGGGLRPYAMVGVGLVNAQAADVLEIFQIRRTVPAFKIGIGVQALLLTNNVGIRADLRHVRSFTDDDGSLARVGRRISYSRFTIGLLLRL